MASDGLSILTELLRGRPPMIGTSDSSGALNLACMRGIFRARPGTLDMGTALGFLLTGI
jgi:hypothetical protein